MKKMLLLAVLLALGMASTVWADGFTQVVSSTTTPIRTRTVFNDSGGELTSGAVVVWDNDDTEFDRSGYPYVTTVATADSIWVAGVLLNNACPDQALCEIVVEGWAATNVGGSLTEDTLVATSTTAGRIGDYTPAANTCALGLLTENNNLAAGTNGLCGASTFCQVPVYVHISCQ